MVFPIYDNKEKIINLENGKHMMKIMIDNKCTFKEFEVNNSNKTFCIDISEEEIKMFEI